MKYTLPKKAEPLILEIEGLGELTIESSFVDKMNFQTRLGQLNKLGTAELMTTVIKESLPEEWATAIIETGNVVLISDIFTDIASNKMGLTREEFLKYGEKK